MFEPFYKYFNINLISLRAGISNQKVYKNLNGVTRDSLTESEKQEILNVIEKPVKKMFEKFGAEIEIKK